MKNYFIVNKASRTGKAAETWNEIQDYLEKNKIEYQALFTTGAGDATEFAKKITSQGEKVGLFVMGGDGTLNEALKA